MDALCIILACIVFDGQWWIFVVWPVTWCHADIKGVEQSHRWFWMEICGGFFWRCSHWSRTGCKMAFSNLKSFIAVRWGMASEEWSRLEGPAWFWPIIAKTCLFDMVAFRSPLHANNYNAGKHADLNAYIVCCLFVWVMSLRFRIEYDLSSPWHVWSHKSNMEFPKMGVPPIIQVMDDHFSTFQYWNPWWQRVPPFMDTT